MEPLMTFRGVSMSFFGHSMRGMALESVDAVFVQGRTTAIVGANASGKSTMLRLAAGVIRPTEGAVVWSRAQRATSRAFVPQRSALAADFTARETVSLGTAAKEAPAARVDAALEAVGLLSRGHVRYHSMSGGEQQRVRVARALAQVEHADGSALLLDEPFSSLDPAEVARLVEALRAFTGAGGSVILSLHDAGLAREVAQAAIALRQGRVLASGGADEVLAPASLRAVYAHEMLEATERARWLRPRL